MDENAPRATAGVAFVINKTLIEPKNLTSHEIQAGRALALNINWLEMENTTLLNVYAPNDRADHPAFWMNLETGRRTKGIARPNFLLGDFNLTEEAIDRMPAHLDDPRAIEALRELRHNWDLQDAWRKAYPEGRVFTYRSHANQTKSRLDRIYIAQQTLDLTYDWEITPSAVPTDHWMAIIKFAPKSAPHIGRGRWSLPLSILNNKTFIKEIINRGMDLQNRLEYLKNRNIPRRSSNLQRLWKDFKEDIKEIAKEQMDKTHYKLTSRIKAIEKDMKELARHPDADTNLDIRTRENILAHERSHLERKQAKSRKGNLSASLALHGEKMGGTWSAMSTERKPRDLIRHLKIPDSQPPRYERNTKRMANLAKEYHENLQKVDMNQLEDFDERVNLILEEIPGRQRLPEPRQSNLNYPLTEVQTEKALHCAKNGTATGMDGCPNELWKTLKTHYDTAKKLNKPGFDIIKTLTELYNDIQTHGVEGDSNFSLGWMCPIYKKKDPTEISNYRPITLLNTDYKLLTKVLAIQLTDHIEQLIHSDQVGFIPRRSIFDQIRLAKAIINYAEITEENGAIIALDQEKAYDKIRHDYLWATLEAFNLPDPFIKTIKALYQDAKTQIAINGVLSEPFKVTRGIRQGDPISCGIFDLGIEPLACLIRKDVNFKGITIPGIEEPIKVNLFADDTNLYLSQSDRFDYAQAMLADWCQISGAKFNIEKTEIIPIGTPEHRRQVAANRKINPNDLEPLDPSIKIAVDGDAVRSLGAWIGNKIDDATPWEQTIDKVHKSLEKWRKTNPSMNGRKIIAQAIIGGHTQFLTKAQGMPKHVEEALTKITRQFMWEDDSSPRIAMDLLYKPIEEGGFVTEPVIRRIDAPICFLLRRPRRRPS
jgi:hypothetical protein